MPTILLKKSDTPGSVPGTANLTNLAGGVEVAVNTADKRVYSMTSASAVIELGTNPSSLTLSGGTANGVLYLNGSKVATSGTALTFDGTNFGVGTASYGNAGSINAAVGVPGTTTGGLQLWSSTTANHFVQFGDGTAGDGPYRGAVGYNHTLDSLLFYAAGAEKAVLNSTGLGIGTASPAYKLDVNGVGRNQSRFIVGPAVDSSDRMFYVSGNTSTSGASQFGAVINPTLPNTVTSSAYGIYTGLTIASGATVTNGYGLYLEGMSAGGSTVTNKWGLYVADTNNSYIGGNLGIGTASPTDRLNVGAFSGNNVITIGAATTGTSSVYFGDGTGADRYRGYIDYEHTNDRFVFGTSGTGKAYLDSSGNLGLGVTPSAWSTNFSIRAMQFGGGSVFSYGDDRLSIGQNIAIIGSGTDSYINTAAASVYQQYQGQHRWFNAPSGTAGTAITLTQAMTLDASGNLLVGTTSSPSYGSKLRVEGGIESFSSQFNVVSGTSTQFELVNRSASAGFDFYVNSGGTLAARITSGGDLLVGTTSAVQFNTSTVTGWNTNSSGQMAMAASAAPTAYFNRLTDDGTIISLRQAGVEEGTISVSGNTVSYNAFAGSHWSQLEDGSKPDILRGTVLESINELCEWPGEENERLPKAKISDTAGSKKVYGVFMAWDNDWTETNDMYVTAVGAFICRVNGSVTVQEGDLLESNGDGTARVQADDIIRSSTIGKVTSTVKTHEYDDGSYCVPTVLYCG